MSPARNVSLALFVIAVACCGQSSSFAIESLGVLGTKSFAAETRVVDHSAQDEQDAETAALALVRDQLPALQSVLDRLRSDAPAQYEKAVRDISRSAKRLESVRRRDEQLYQLELDLLKSRTTLSLLVARLRVRDNEPDRVSLRSAILQLHSAELARAEYEVELLHKRFQRTQEQLDEARARLTKHTSDPNERLNAAYTDYLRKAGRSTDSSATKKRTREKGETKK